MQAKNAKGADMDSEIILARGSEPQHLSSRIGK